jgi:hypothetical protein
MKSNKRFTSNFQRISDGLKLSGEKIIKYQAEIQQNEQSAGANA